VPRPVREKDVRVLPPRLQQQAATMQTAVRLACVQQHAGLVLCGTTITMQGSSVLDFQG
jgi:hypothetical protein